VNKSLRLFCLWRLLGHHVQLSHLARRILWTNRQQKIFTEQLHRGCNYVAGNCSLLSEYNFITCKQMYFTKSLKYGLRIWPSQLAPGRWHSQNVWDQQAGLARGDGSQPPHTVSRSIHVHNIHNIKEYFCNMYRQPYNHGMHLKLHCYSIQTESVSSIIIHLVSSQTQFCPPSVYHLAFHISGNMRIYNVWV